MAVNEPRRDGTRIGETVGSWRWTGREWVSSGNGYANSNSGLPFIGNLGDMSDVKTDGDGNLIIDFPDDLFAGIDFGPKHYPIQLYWNSSPAVNMKVAHNGDTKTSWNSADFLGGKTFTGKAGGYGESENSFTVTTTENAGVYGFPLYEVKITDSTGGSSILSGAHTGTFKFKKEEVIVIDPPTDYTLEIICDFSSGYVANVSGTSINNSRITLIKLK